MGRIIPKHVDLQYTINMVPVSSETEDLYNEERSVVRGLTKEEADNKLQEYVDKLLGNGVWKAVEVLDRRYEDVAEQEVDDE